MKLSSLQRLAGAALVLGSLLLAVYASAFPALLPLAQEESDFAALVLSPHWIWLAVVAWIGVLLMITGFAGLYSRLYESAGWTGFVGFVALEGAYLLQACMVTWEIFLYPVIARHPAAVPLLRDRLIENSELVGRFTFIATAALILGTVLFVFSLVRSREFPKTGGLALFVGAVLYGLQLNVPSSIAGILIHSLGCLILSLRLFRREDAAARA